MPRVLGVDIGARSGFGLLGADEGVRSGSFQFVEDWYPLGRKCVEWERRMREAIEDYRPDHIGLARQFLRKGKGGKMHDTPKNLIPLYWAFATVIKIAHEMGITCHWVQESDARLLMLGAGNMPATSKELKAAIFQACRDRGWPCCDTDASDGLCMAAAVVEKLNTGAGHQTAPLFLAAAPAPPPPRRRRRKA